MAFDTKPEFVRLGSIWRQKENPDKTFVRFGSTTARKAEYNFTVELIVKDNEGKEVLRVENPIVNILAPIANGKYTPPENLLGDLSFMKK